METDPSGPTGPQLSERPEIAHVLFLDVVAFTPLPMEEQRENLKRLQQIVSATPTFRQAEREKRLILYPVVSEKLKPYGRARSVTLVTTPHQHRLSH